MFFVSNMFTLLLLLGRVYSSHFVDCISVVAPKIADCSAYNDYHLVSCGIDATQTLDIHGVEMSDNKCYVKENPTTGLADDAVARCCRFSHPERNVAFTFTPRISYVLGNKSDICDDCTSTAECDDDSVLVGCNMYAHGVNGGMDGGWIGNIDTSNVLNGGIQLSSIDNNNNKCVANNGWEGQGQYAQAICIQSNDFFETTCERVLGNSSDTESTVSCLNNNEHLFGCNGIGLWNNIHSWYIEKRDDKDVCVAKNLDHFDGSPVWAMGLCCQSKQIKKMVDHLCDDEDFFDDDDDDEDDDEDYDEIDSNDYCRRYNWIYDHNTLEYSIFGTTAEFKEYLTNNTEIWKNETRDKIANNSNITYILQNLIEMNQKAEYVLKELKAILSKTQENVGVDKEYFQANEYLFNVLIDNHRILYSEALDLWNRNHEILTSLAYWTSEDIIKWIMDLDEGRYLKYETVLSSNILKRNVTGSYISKIDKYDLERWGVLCFKDQCDLIDSIKKLIDEHEYVNVETAMITWNKRNNEKDNKLIPTNIHTFGDNAVEQFCQFKDIFRQHVDLKDDGMESIFHRRNHNRFGVLKKDYGFYIYLWGHHYDVCDK